MPTTFTNLILDVRDLDQSLAFYQGLLQFQVTHEESFDGHRLATIATGKTELMLVQQPVDEQNPVLDRSGGQVMNFRVDNLPDLAKSLEGHEVKILRELEMAIWGDRTLLVADPDGYAVLLSEPVATFH